MTVALLAIAGGCGTSKPKAQVVTGPGFHFSAPSAWPVSHKGAQVTAGSDADMVQVSVFPLVKTYRPALFSAVTRELKVRMDALAARSGGTVEDAGVAAPAGLKSHVWRLTSGGHVDEYTFVLSGRKEFELLCHRPVSGDAAACRQLAATFALG